jgi:phosphopantothenoylcysteine decarboxylase/phosphopantothenate--cysteine ligase
MKKQEDKVKKIVLGVTGSIAAYKAVEILRELQRQGYDIHVVMTRNAAEFVGEVTFRTLSRNPVFVGMFEQPEDWVPEHVSLADSADLILIAPATANIIAKMANGLADDMLSSIVLAAKCPVVIAPAMNVNMWTNPATVENVNKLKKRGMRIIEVEDGYLSCGYEGKGRLASISTIITEAVKVLK